jgi:hypothetical protein
VFLLFVNTSSVNRAIINFGGSSTFPVELSPREDREIRSTKSETRNKSESSNGRNPKLLLQNHPARFRPFLVWSFEFVSDFELRISDLSMPMPLKSSKNHFGRSDVLESSIALPSTVVV